MQGDIALESKTPTLGSHQQLVDKAFYSAHPTLQSYSDLVKPYEQMVIHQHEWGQQSFSSTMSSNYNIPWAPQTLHF